MDHVLLDVLDVLHLVVEHVRVHVLEVLDLHVVDVVYLVVQDVVLDVLAVVQDLVKAALGYEDYEPSEETGIKVSNGIVSYAQASGAPLYVTRRYDVIKQEKLYTVDVEMAALANVSYWVEGLYRLTMMEDDTNPLGYRITSVQKINNSVTVSSVDASSTLTEGSNTTKYHRNNVTDHSMLTAWVEGASGNGIGESITLNLDGEQLVHGFRIASGYMKSNTTYNENAAPTKLGIELSGGVMHFSCIMILVVTVIWQWGHPPC